MLSLFRTKNPRYQLKHSVKKSSLILSLGIPKYKTTLLTISCHNQRCMTFVNGTSESAIRGRQRPQRNPRESRATMIAISLERRKRRRDYIPRAPMECDVMVNRGQAIARKPGGVFIGREEGIQRGTWVAMRKGRSRERGVQDVSRRGER